MEIRFAEKQDVKGILDLLKQVGSVHHEGRPDLFRSGAQKYGASQVLAMLDSSESPIFVATEEKRVLGYSFCQIHRHPQDPVLCDVLSLYIDDLCVDERARGKGVGRALYEAVCRYAKMRKCYNITLNVWSCNKDAMAFYEKMGLKPQKIGMESILEQC